MKAIEQIEAMLADIDLFGRRAVELTILCFHRGDDAMA